MGDTQKIPVIEGRVYGYIPQKGIDYFTDADKAEMASSVLSTNRVASLNETELASATIIEAVGAPTYVEDVTGHANYGLTDSGWYVFARITAPDGVNVTDATTVTGVAGYIIGEDYVDVAVRFEVASMSQLVVINWGSKQESFVFKATDLAIRNLDYRVTFYVYDVEPFATWEFALTADTSFGAGKYYWVQQEDGTYAAAEVTTGDAIPAYYTLADETYTQATGVFEEGVTYYTKSGAEYTAAEVSVGEAIPAYYNHSKVTFEGMVRNITYVCNTPIDCPVTFVLPAIEDETHGCWFEVRCLFVGTYSTTLVPPTSDIKVATEHTQQEQKGVNMINLHYTAITGTKVWRFMNTRSTIPE